MLQAATRGLVRAQHVVLSGGTPANQTNAQGQTETFLGAAWNLPIRGSGVPRLVEAVAIR